MRAVKLSDLCEIIMGQSPPSASYNKNNEGLPFYQGNADFGKINPIPKVWCNAPHKIAQKSDILLSVRAPIGALNIAAEACCIGRGLAALRPLTKKCSHIYLYNALKSRVDFLQQQGTGSTFKAINKAILENLPIPFCEINEQSHIADIFSNIDNTAHILEKQLDKLDTFVKSRFIEMFGDPVTNPRGLPDELLGDVCLLKAGITTSPQEIREHIDEEYNVPCYGGNGIRGYVKTATYHGDYPIIGRQGALCGNVQFASGDFHATEHAVLVTPKISLNPIWLYVTLREMNLNRFHTGAAQPGLAVKTLNTVNIITPPIALQNQFADFVALAYKSKLIIHELLAKHELMKAALMQQYFG